MNRGIYTAVSGMLAAQKWMDVTANNLANVSTTGYKRDSLSFVDAFEQQLSGNFGAGQPIGRISGGTAVDEQYTIFEQGAMRATNNPLDFALQDNKTMFKVQGPNGPAYTRDGSFQVDAARQLVTHDGYPVLDSNDRPITLPNNGPVSVDTAGNVSVGDQNVGKLSLNEGNFVKVGSNLYRSGDAKVATSALVLQGQLEGSNVNAVTAMVDMIQIGRIYELTQKSINQQDDLMQRLIASLHG